METNALWDTFIHSECYTPQQRKGKKCTPTNSFLHLCFASSHLIDSVYFSGMRFHYGVIALLHPMQHSFVLSKKYSPLSLRANWNGNILILSATKWQDACISGILYIFTGLENCVAVFLIIMTRQDEAF